MERKFKITQGTIGLVLIQEPNTDLVFKSHQAQKTSFYTEEHVLVDPVKVENFGNAVYEKDSEAARLAKAGYIVFSNAEGGKQSKYMFAVPYDQVQITN